MIRRKDSLGFVDFMRGRYNLTDVVYIQNIIDEMTFDEKESIMLKSFNELWTKLWGGNPGIQYRMEENDSKIKFNKLKEGIIINKQLYSIRTFIFDSKTKWREQEWGFPKGRRNYKESDIICALREFEEETGYDRKSVTLIQNLSPLQEIFTGSNYKSYNHCYFIGFIKNDIAAKKTHQLSEVSKIEWKKYNNVMECIREYNIEKKNIVYNTKQILDTYEIYV
jgi:ADP-ribose pyrophosphatase YjhB (NUDIX family)